MAQSISRFVPRARSRPLNWKADPMFGVDKETVSAATAKTGLDYNKRLYAPESEEMKALFRPPAKPTYPTGYVGPSRPMQPGEYTSRYGTASLKMFPGQAATQGIAKLQSANPFNPELPNPNLEEDVLAENTGAAGPIGDPETVSSPDLATVDPVEPPNIDLPLTPPTALATNPTPAVNDNDYATGILGEMDAIMKGLDGEAPASPARPMIADEEPMNMVNPKFQSPISARPPSDVSPTGGIPWRLNGTALDERPQSNGPSPSTFRYYQRILDRSEVGNEAQKRDAYRRVNRFIARARPTNAA